MQERRRIETATADDVGEIWTLQRAAYLDEAQAYGDPYLPPLTETAGQITAMLHAGLLLLKAEEKERIVGTVRGRSAGSAFLVNRLAVAPDRRRCGIARALLAELERRALLSHPGTTEFALFTGHTSEGNLRLYRSLGYTEARRERIADHLSLVHLRKPVAEH